MLVILTLWSAGRRDWICQVPKLRLAGETLIIVFSASGMVDAKDGNI
jgi:hypothetical protein